MLSYCSCTLGMLRSPNFAGRYTDQERITMTLVYPLLQASVHQLCLTLLVRGCVCVAEGERFVLFYEGMLE